MARKQCFNNIISWFVRLQEIWLGNNVSWFAHFRETWLRNNVFWFAHLRETWLGSNVSWFAHKDFKRNFNFFQIVNKTCTKVVDIAMILDESGSIGYSDFQDIKKFVGDVISHFSVTPFGAHFAAVKYSSSPREVFSLTKYTDAAQLHIAVQNMNYKGGSTYTGQALEMVQQNVTDYSYLFINLECSP